MPVFNDSQQLYSVLTELLREVEIQFPSVIQEFDKSKMRVLLKLSTPELQITVGSNSDGLEVNYGADKTRPNLTVEMTADLLDGILMGDQSLKQAIASGNVTVKGPFWKMISLGKVFQYGKSAYPMIKENHGLERI